MIELARVHVRLTLLSLVGLELSVKFSSHGRSFRRKKVALIAENYWARKQLSLPSRLDVQPCTAALPPLP
jgi:hypothetical protein